MLRTASLELGAKALSGRVIGRTRSSGDKTYLTREAEGPGQNGRGVAVQTWWDHANPYRYRNDNLEAMGFGSFRAYLKSPLWQSIRARVFEAQPLCIACGRKKATQVHHRAYDPKTLRGDCLNSLSAVCARCHRKAERPDEMREGMERLHDASYRLRPRKRMMDRCRENRARVLAGEALRPVWGNHVKPGAPQQRQKRAARVKLAPLGPPRLVKRAGFERFAGASAK